LSELLSPVLFQFGTGGIGGFIVGFAIKKISKLLAILVGIFIAFILYLATQGIITVNYEALWNFLESLLAFAKESAAWFIGFISLLPFMGSFVAGLILGLKIG
jgi:uncharacterized membrane protein (Fun14 family)